MPLAPDPGEGLHMQFDRMPNGVHNNNINNSRISPTKPGMPTSNGSAVGRSAGDKSQNRHAHENRHENSDSEENMTDDEIKQQTRKVVEAFLRGVLAKNANAARVQRQETEPKRAATTPLSENSRIRMSKKDSKRATTPQQVPLKQSPDEVLQQVMKGIVPETYRHRSNVSVGSSDSYDSGIGKTTGRFQRTKSFSKAQRHSVVTELENRGNKTPDSRRSSLDTSTPSQRHNLYGDTVADGGRVGPQPRHAHANSDPVAVVYDTHVKDSTEMPKEEKKKGFWKKFMAKRKDGHKSKEEIPQHMSDVVEEVQQKSRAGKRHGDRHTVSRESSLSANRRTPSPPGSPKAKRTPNLMRRFSKRKKGPKSESPARGERSQSLEFDKLLDDDKYTANGDPKSNSLPMTVNLDVRPPAAHQPHSVHNRRLREADSEVAVDGHKFKPHPPSHARRNSEDVVRPTTLNIPKKKTSTMKKFRKFIRIDSSSSSSDEAFEDSLKSSSQSFSAGTKQDSFKRSSLPERKISTVKHSESDRPTNDSVRNRYQHRPSKSMSDMDQCTEIAIKLRRLAEHYGHIMAQQQRGQSSPTRTTHLPDSLASDAKKKSAPGVNRAISLTAGSNSLPSVRTPSLKAFYNLQPANQRTGRTDESREGGRLRQRITRDQISHQTTGSFDSPHRTTRVYRAYRGTRGRVVNENHVKRAKPDEPEFVAHGPVRGSSPPSPRKVPRSPRHVRTGPHAPPPPPMRSQSPPLPVSHTRGVVADSAEPPVPKVRERKVLHHELHRETTKTMETDGVVRKEVERVDEVDDDVVADAFPFGSADSAEAPPSPDLSAFHETIHRETMRTTPSGTNIRQVTDEEYDIRTMTGHTSQTEDVGLFAAAAPRRRAATSPSVSFPSEEDGAVGGKEDEMNEDKLVMKIAEALCKKGDGYNISFDNTPVLEEAVMQQLRQLSYDSLKGVLTRVLSAVTEQTACSSFSHPEIVQLALIFNTAEFVIRACMQPSTIAQSLMSALSTNFINPIVQRIGGWGRVQSSIDETQRELETLEDEPSSSGISSHGRNHSPETDEELD